MKEKAARSSTTRSTAGSGFDFEDQVAAWLLLKVLTGQSLPGVEGIGKRLQMQVESLGWAIDDILLTATMSPDDQRHLAISCKSNVQVTASGLPADFVGRCWKQWAQADRNPMRRDKDKQMLVTRGRHNAFMATWSELKNCARDADVALALSRMRATAKHRKIFESVKAPAEDVGVTPSDADVVAMVDSIDVIPLDFQTANSECERLAIAQSRMLLESGSLTEGKRLWRELVGKTRNVRLGSGTLEISDLWKRLRSDYALRDHPDYESSWQKLRALTQDHKGTIETALSSGQALDRKGAADKLLEWIAEDVVCVVFGESGSGKSALVKTVLNERFPNDTQVWFLHQPDQVLDRPSEQSICLLHSSLFPPSARCSGGTCGSAGRQGGFQSGTALPPCRSAGRQSRLPSGLSPGRRRRPHHRGKVAGTRVANAGMGDRRGREQPWRAPLYPVCAHSSPSGCGCKPDRQGSNVGDDLSDLGVADSFYRLHAAEPPVVLARTPSHRDVDGGVVVVSGVVDAMHERWALFGPRGIDAVAALTVPRIDPFARERIS